MVACAKRSAKFLLASALGLPGIAIASPHFGTVPPGWPGPERHRDIVNHWSDAFNFLDLVPGPEFLVLFVSYSIAITVLLLLLRNLLLHLAEPGATFAQHNRLPFNLKPNALELAYLRGGAKAILETALCNLYSIGILKCSLRRSGKMIQPQPSTLTPLEKSICAAIDAFVEPHALIKRASISTELDRVARGAQAKLSMLGLLPGLATWSIAGVIVVLGLFLIDGLAGIRLVRSELRGYHNVEFLWILALLAPVAAAFVLLRIRRSRAGDRYLKQLRNDAKAVVRKMQALRQRDSGPELLYAIAACGAAALVGTDYEMISAQLVPPKPTSDSSCSSCGGGGCGGGGCGGGGCGGG